MRLERHGKLGPISTVGEWDGEAKLSVPMETGAMSFGLISLSARSDGREYSTHDREILQQAASVVALAIEQDQTAERFTPI